MNPMGCYPQMIPNCSSVAQFSGMGSIGGMTPSQPPNNMTPGMTPGMTPHSQQVSRIPMAMDYNLNLVGI